MNISDSPSFLTSHPTSTSPFSSPYSSPIYGSSPIPSSPSSPPSPSLLLATSPPYIPPTFSPLHPSTPQVAPSHHPCPLCLEISCTLGIFHSIRKNEMCSHIVNEITHPFQLESAYRKYSRTSSGVFGEPPYTTFTASFTGCIDYIFHDSTIVVSSLLPIPILGESCLGLPSAQHPSDHLPLMIDFEFDWNLKSPLFDESEDYTP
jgi:hypothetical protein